MKQILNANYNKKKMLSNLVSLWNRGTSARYNLFLQKRQCLPRRSYTQAIIFEDLNDYTPPEQEESTHEHQFKRTDFLSLQPEEIMKELDKHIVGQTDAKRAVAIAMRNRWRRNKVDEKLRKEIIPKNILMVGPTGCGKTEVARRMASLADAPFIKVEATKFTEVGFKGQDVDQIIKDLLDVAIRLVRERETKRLSQVLLSKVEQVILDILIGKDIKYDKYSEFFREEFRQLLRKGDLENHETPDDVRVPRVMKNQVITPLGTTNKKVPEFDLVQICRAYISEQQRAAGRRQNSNKNISISELRKRVLEAETQKVLSYDSIIKEAIWETEEYGIVFIDELDKIAAGPTRYHSDASDEGVQRDLLPLIEGTKITTDHGDVDTSKILFITAGAFHQAKPSDLLAELQGRLPIRVILNDLTEDDMYRILTEPECHSVMQHRALLKTEGVDLRFTDEAVREIARVASEVNQSVENIGARRLFTVLEKVLEDLSYNANSYKGQTVIIDKSDVEKQMRDVQKKSDLKQYIL